MTNETTASQPTDFRKVLVEVRESLQFANDSPNGGIDDTIWMMHSSAPETVFDFIDAALDGGPSTPQKTADLFASQPKSIGDEAQLPPLPERTCLLVGVYAYTARQMQEYAKEAIDSRAPAAQASTEEFRVIAAEASAKVLVLKRQLREAQASATIQAAPNKDAIRKVFMDHGFTIKAGETDLKQYVFDAANALLALVVAIQEPVMVAEPVGESFSEKLAREMREGTAVFVSASKPAAPMVADPADVALLDSRFLHSKEIASDEPIVDSTRLSFWRQGWNAYRSAIAATVKAVPKIRITLRQARLLVDFFGGHDADVTVTERPAVWEQVEEGLYAFCTEYPEDGAQFLGATEVDDELMRLGTVESVPSEALTDARILEIAAEQDYGDEDPKCIIRLARALFAAPLADKTGGGE